MPGYQLTSSNYHTNHRGFWNKKNDRLDSTIAGVEANDNIMENIYRRSGEVRKYV